jgi:hypothetical protein
MGSFNSILVPFEDAASASEAQWQCFPFEVLFFGGIYPFDTQLCVKAWQAEDKQFVQTGLAGLDSDMYGGLGIDGKNGVLFKANGATTTNLVEIDEGSDPVTIISAASIVMSDKPKVVIDKSNPYGAFFEDFFEEGGSPDTYPFAFVYADNVAYCFHEFGGVKVVTVGITGTAGKTISPFLDGPF